MAGHMAEKIPAYNIWLFGAQSLAGNLPYKLGLRSMNMIDSKSFSLKSKQTPTATLLE
jgi:hypothetical protein